VTGERTAWDPEHLPSQVGKTVVVTGAGRGIGYFIAEQLASAGARVVLTTRDPKQAGAAARAIRTEVPTARLEFVTLDLASLESIHAAAAAIRDLGPIDVLINNGGMTSGPRTRQTTADGLELTVGTNAFGPFALTALVWPALSATARVVSLGSLSTRLTKADLDNFEQTSGRFSFSTAYAYSKHGMHAFAFELDRKLRASGSAVQSLLAHPGFALDGWAPHRPGVNKLGSPGTRFFERVLGFMSHGRDRGAWPIVRAAIGPDAAGGEFYGPSRSVVGVPVITTPVAQSADTEFGRRFWTLAETATGLTFEP
jgi:NAD(P)-dependent dehydrogenase (short-subunit alcohol dehydrogenase family)